MPERQIVQGRDLDFINFLLSAPRLPHVVQQDAKRDVNK